MSHDAARVPPNGIPVGLFGESSRAGNQSEKEPSALSHFLSCISESTAWKAITRLKEACISRLNTNSNLSTSDVNVSFADLRVRYPDLAIITPCLSHGRVVVSAVKSGHYDILEGLLRNGPISIEDRGTAVVKASSLDGLNTLRIIEMLLENGPISENHQLLARLHNLERIRIADRFYHISKIENPNGFRAEISRRTLDALISVQELLRDADISHVPLMRNCTISDVDRGRAVVNAAEYGYHDIVATLLQNGQISDEHRGEAVMHAARNGHIDVLERLSHNREISDEHRGWGVMSAARGGHVDVIDMLLRNGQISDEDRGHAVIEAINCPNRNLIQGTIERLLQDGAGIPRHLLVDAVWHLNHN